MKKARKGKVGIIIALAAAISCSSAIAIAQLCSKDFGVTETAYADASSGVATQALTAEETASLWNSAVQKSIKTGNAVTVTLENDWTAAADTTYTKSFGTGVGFDSGRIYVPASAKIVLDLNGNTINRNLTSAIANGEVIYVDGGSLEITDSSVNDGVGTITGGKNTGNGGGIYVNNGGTLTLSKGLISNNVATSGGGVYNDTDSTFTMNGGEISGNLANGAGGGGVYGYSGTFNMDGGTVSNNASTNNGGGVYGSGTSSNKFIFTMTGGKITENVATNANASRGGGGVILDSYCTFTMNGGEISNNTSGYTGGGVRVYTDSTFTMSGSAKISGNTAVYGGGVYVYCGTFNMDGGEISGNTSANGGGVDGYGTSSNYFIFTMTGGKITDNEVTATSSGGGGVRLSNYSTFTMEGGKISGNTSAGNGGGLYSNNTSYNKFIMNGGEISGNTAVYGGGVYAYGTSSSPFTFTMTGGKITGNTTTTSAGGGVYVGNYSMFTMSGSAEISGNTAATSGGGLYFSGYATTVTMNGGEISGNTAKNGGGGVSSSGSSSSPATFTMTGGKITGNSTTMANGGNTTYYGGGGVLIGNYITFTMEGGEISNNTSASYGGGVSAYNTYSAKFIMEGGEISSNTATNSGGGVYGHGYGSSYTFNFTMTGGKITGNKTTSTSTSYYGGGVCVGSYSTFTMEDGEISDNTTAGNGGGVYCNGYSSSYPNTFKMTGGKITGNTTSSNGGGLYLNSYSTSTMEDGEISGNTSAGSGGGVYIASGTFEMSGSKISGNTAATYGGGLYYGSSNTFKMTDSEISGNTATANYGGGVYYTSSYTFTMTNSKINDNKSGSSGGGVYFSSSPTFNMTDSEICGNTAATAGGGVYASSSFTFTMTNGKINDNTASNGSGGGLYYSSGTFTMNGGEIRGNSATANGGGVYVYSTFNLSNGIIYGNTKSDGTANNVYLYSTSYTINITGALSADKTYIAVYVTSARTITGNYASKGNTSAQVDQFFVSDNASYKMSYSSSNVTTVSTSTPVEKTNMDWSYVSSVSSEKVELTDGELYASASYTGSTFVFDAITNGLATALDENGVAVTEFKTVGKYYFQLNPGERVNYNNIFFTFEILPIDVVWSYVSHDVKFTTSVKVTPDEGEISASATYTGGTFVFDAVKNGLAIAVDENGRNVTNFKNVGKYYISVPAGKRANYNNPFFTFEILPADVSNENVTVKTNPVVYTGSEVSTSVQVILNGFILEENVDYTVSFNNNVQVGTANVVITAMGNYTGTYNGTFTIEKAKLGVRWGLTTLPYNGSKQDIVALPEGLLGDDTVTFTVTYYDKNNEEVEPVDVGEYLAVVTLDDTTYQLFRVYEKTFTIVQKKVDAVWSATSFVYDGEAHEITAYFMAGDEKVDLEVVTQNLINAGTYKATTALPDGYDNYVLTANTAEITYVIEKAEVEAVWPNGYNFKYDGTKKEITVTVGLGNVDLSDSITYTYYDESGAEVEPLAAGTYKVVITLDEDNYALKGKTEDTFIITKATLVVTWNDDYNGVYNGEEKTPLASVRDSLGNVFENYSATYVKVDEDGNVIKNLGATLPTDVGSYVLTIETHDANLEEATVTKTFDITPKTIQVEWDFGDLAIEINGVQTYLYDGASHQPTATADGIKLTVTGSGKSVRDDYRTVASLNDANYVLSGDIQVSFNIIKSKVVSVIWYEYGKTEPVAEDETPSYEYVSVNGQDGARLSAYGVLAAYDDEVVWNNQNTTLIKLTVTYPEYSSGFWAIGTYTAKAVLSSADSANYACYMPINTSNTLDFEVTNVTHSAHVADILWVVVTEEGTHVLAKDYTFIYNGQKQAPIAIQVLSNTYELDNPLDGTYKVLNVGGAKVNAGTYYAYIIPEGNYEIKDEDAEFKFVIKPLEITIDWGETTFIYNGSEQAPEATVQGADNLECKVTVQGYVNAGTYTAIAKVNNNFAIVDGAETEFTIEQIKLSVNDIVWGFNENDEGAERTDENGAKYFVWTFDGNTHVPAATLKVRFEEDGEEVEIQLAVTGGDSAAGTHYAYVTLESSDPANANYEMEIARIRFDIVYTSVTVIWEDVNEDGEIVFDYDGEEHTPKAYYIVGEGEEETRVYLNVVGSGTNAGKYVAVITDKIDSADGLTKEFTIKAQQIKAEWTNTSLTYNGKVRTPSVTFVDLETEETVTLQLGVDYAVKGFVNAGTYTSEITLINGNYEIGDTSGEHEFTIAKKSITLTWHGVENSTDNFVWDYDGKAYAPTAETGIDGLEVTVKGAELQVGTYTAVAILDNDNYTVTNPEREFTIKGSTISVIWDFEDALTAEDENGEAYYYWQYEGDGTVYAPKAYIKQADGSKGGELTVVGGGIYAGKHTAKAILPENCSWAEGETGECEFVISKKIVDGIIWMDEDGNELDEFDWEYDGKYHAPTAKIASSGEVLTVIGAQLNVCGDGVTYTATAILANSDNYEFAFGAEDGKIYEKEFKIHAKPVSVTWKGETGSDKDEFVWTYDGEVHCPTAWYTDVYGNEVEIPVVGGTASSGQYNAELRGDIFTNYVFDESLKQPFTIKELGVTATWNAAPEADEDGKITFTYTYNGKSQMPEATLKTEATEEGAEGNAVELTYLIKDKDGSAVSAIINVGTYTVTVSPSDKNYKVTAGETTVTVVVEPKPVAVHWGDTTLTENGAAQAPKAWFFDVNGQKIELTVEGEQTEVNGEGETYPAKATLESGNYVLDEDSEEYPITTTFTIVKSTATEYKWVWGAEGNGWEEVKDETDPGDEEVVKPDPDEGDEEEEPLTPPVVGGEGVDETVDNNEDGDDSENENGTLTELVTPGTDTTGGEQTTTDPNESSKGENEGEDEEGNGNE
ncbi:MAG: MBG domain-containing protein [Clostridia bacterium]|nr:MBG domain-containing protein [Clostridia bacterium]